MKKILFLDIDGVLNSGEYSKKLNHIMVINGNGDFPDIDIEAMNKLNEIIKATDCEVVLTSGWRTFPNIENYLIEKGLCKPIMDKTIVSYIGRDYEIKYYLQTHEYSTFAILDDNDFNLSETFPFNFIQTTFQYGLTDELKNNVINKLK